MDTPFDVVLGPSNKLQRNRGNVTPTEGETYPYYVTMTVAKMSMITPGKIFKLVIGCNDAKQAKIVSENAQNRGDMKRVTIHTGRKKPTYPKRTHSTRSVTPNAQAYAQWYTKGAF